VRATALDALQNGFAPFVVREACGERDVRPQEANLFDLQAKYAEVVSLERALQDIARNGRAAGPR
jgi:maleamate amidohydrolase